MASMTDSQTSQVGFQLKTGRTIGAAVLIGMIGGILAFVSAIMAGSALVGAMRRWMRQKEVPPGVLARQNLARARAATAAGVGAWRDEQPAAAPPPT
jgi:hypothetical protein